MSVFTRALAVFALCAAASPATAACLSFEAPPAGTTAGVGPLMALPAGNINLRAFLNGAGWTVGGVATVVASTIAGGSGVQEANLNNINLQVVPTPAVTSATFVYADFGGNVNLATNGVLLSRPDLSGMPAVIGGTNVAVTRINFFGYHIGTVTLTAPPGGAINVFAVGGQEFLVDDVCW